MFLSQMVQLLSAQEHLVHWMRVDMTWMMVFILRKCHLDSQYLANLIQTTERVNIDNMGDLVVNDDADCDKISQKGWKSITVNSGLCNSMTDLVISFYPYLEWIYVSESSLQNVQHVELTSIFFFKSLL